MDDVKRLNELLKSGALLHPVSDAPSIVDLANAMHSVIGLSGLHLNEKAMEIRNIVGEPDHLVMILADGFGMNFVEALDEGSFVRSHLATEIRTVFPSTTPIALTTLATGEWPCAHSVIGWFLRLRRINAVSTIISYIRTADKKPLSELGVSTYNAYPVQSRIGRANRESLHIMPEEIVGSVYSNYWTGGVSQVGYPARSPELAINMAIKHVREARKPTWVYLYLPQVDSAAHQLGAFHKETLNMAKTVDRLLRTLSDTLPSNAKMVMTADHGHLDAPERKRHIIDKSDEIARLCKGVLTGDFRAVYAGVTPEKVSTLKQLIRKRFGEDFLVLGAREVEDAGILGVGRLSEETRYRMEGALILSIGDATLDYRAVLGDEMHPIISHHGGLTPEEMRIPLLVA